MKTVRLALLVLIGAAVTRAHAATPPATEAHLGYAAYAAGLNVLKFDATLDFTPQSYRIDIDYSTTGMFGAMIHADTQSLVAGRWIDGQVQPARFYSYGNVRGRPRRTQIDYDGGQPTLKILEPANDDEREPIPQAMTRNTVDTLSAMALLVHEVAVKGRCEGHVVTYDGRRVSEIAVHDAGEETLTGDGRSIFSGPAHRCDFEGRQLAGFVKDVDPAELKRVQHGSAWLAPVLPGAMPLPVRISFHTRFFGDATTYLVAAAPATTK